MKILQVLVIVLASLSPFKVDCQWLPLPKENLEPVAKIRSIVYDINGAKTGEEQVLHYEDGRLVRQQKFKEGELVSDEVYSYEIGQRKETITRRSTKPQRNTITINYFDKQQRLKRSELYEPGKDKPGYFQSKFKYNKAGQIESHQASSVHSKGRTTNYLQVSHPDEYTLIREDFWGKTREKDSEITIEYDTLFREATFTTVSYEYLPRPDDPPRRKNIYGADRAGEGLWIDRDTIMLNGEARAVNKRIMQSKYIYDDSGNWIELYNMRKDGTAILASRRIIEYKEKRD